MESSFLKIELSSPVVQSSIPVVWSIINTLIWYSSNSIECSSNRSRISVTAVMIWWSRKSIQMDFEHVFHIMCLIPRMFLLVEVTPAADAAAG